MAIKLRHFQIVDDGGAPGARGTRLPDVRPDERQVGGGGRPVEGGLQVDQIPGECGGRG